MRRAAATSATTETAAARPSCRVHFSCTACASGGWPGAAKCGGSGKQHEGGLCDFAEAGTLGQIGGAAAPDPEPVPANHSGRWAPGSAAPTLVAASASFPGLPGRRAHAAPASSRRRPRSLLSVGRLCLSRDGNGLVPANRSIVSKADFWSRCPGTLRRQRRWRRRVQPAAFRGAHQSLGSKREARHRREEHSSASESVQWQKWRRSRR